MIDNLLQCAETNFAGMDYQSLKNLATESAMPVAQARDAFVKLEQAKKDLFGLPLPLDGEVE